MRTILWLAALGILSAGTARAQQPTSPGQSALTADTIIDLVGGDLKKMFGQVGAPKYMVVARGETNDQDDILCEYGNFILRVHENTVTNCFFTRWPDSRNPHWRQPRRRDQGLGPTAQHH